MVVYDRKTGIIKMSKNVFFILVGGSSRTTGDLIKPKKSSKKGPKAGQKRANFNEAADVVAMM